MGNLQDAGHQTAQKLAAVEAEYSGKLSDALGEIQGLRTAQEKAENRVAALQAEYSRKLVTAERQVRPGGGLRHYGHSADEALWPHSAIGPPGTVCFSRG